VTILKTISGNSRLYRPGVRADATAFLRDYGDDKVNLKRLEDSGAISFSDPKVDEASKPAAAKPKGKTAPRRARTTKTPIPKAK